MTLRFRYSVQVDPNQETSRNVDQDSAVQADKTSVNPENQTSINALKVEKLFVFAFF